MTCSASRTQLPSNSSSHPHLDCGPYPGPILCGDGVPSRRSRKPDPACTMDERCSFLLSFRPTELAPILSFRPSEHRERAEESVGRASGKSEIRNPKFKGWVGGCVLTCSSQACPERGRRPSRMDPSVRSAPSGLHSLGMTSCGAGGLSRRSRRAKPEGATDEPASIEPESI